MHCNAIPCHKEALCIAAPKPGILFYANQRKLPRSRRGELGSKALLAPFASAWHQPFRGKVILQVLFKAHGVGIFDGALFFV